MYSYDEEKARFYRMTKSRITELLSWLLEENKKSESPLSADEVCAKFYASKTFACLMNPETDFYWKSMKELRKLIKWEYEGNVFDWERQAYA